LDNCYQPSYQLSSYVTTSNIALNAYYKFVYNYCSICN
ncbi:unnamed protein product, partial [Rotaria magnacalcarata]